MTSPLIPCAATPHRLTDRELDRAVLDLHQRHAHALLRTAVEAALLAASANDLAKENEALEQSIHQSCLYPNLTDVLTYATQPLTQANGPQAQVLRVAGEYLSVLAFHAWSKTEAASPAATSVPTRTQVMAMHELLYGWPPDEDDAAGCLPSLAECTRGFEDFIDYLEFKQERRMLTTLTGIVLYLRAHVEPLRMLDRLEADSLASWTQ